MQYRCVIDPAALLEKLAKPKMSPMSYVLFQKCLFLCVNSVTCLKSAIISSFYIPQLLKIVFSTGVCVIALKKRNTFVFFTSRAHQCLKAYDLSE